MNEQSTQQAEGFKEWAVVEVMGHQRYGGYVSEQTIGGASFVRVDVPAVTVQRRHESQRFGDPPSYTEVTLPAMTKFFGASAIYCITPCTEEVARAAAVSCDREPVSRFEFQESRKLLGVARETEGVETASDDIVPLGDADGEHDAFDDDLVGDGDGWG